MWASGCGVNWSTRSTDSALPKPLRVMHIELKPCFPNFLLTTTFRSRAAVHDCEQYEEDGFMFFQCNIKTDMTTLETWGSAMMDLRNRLVDFQTQTDKIVDLLSLRNAAVNQSLISGEIHPASSTSLSSSSAGPPSNMASSFEANQHETSAEILDSIRPLTEAELHRCPTLSIPKADQMPTVFLLPESNGLE